MRWRAVVWPVRRNWLRQKGHGQRAQVVITSLLFGAFPLERGMQQRARRAMPRTKSRENNQILPAFVFAAAAYRTTDDRQGEDRKAEWVGCHVLRHIPLGLALVILEFDAICAITATK